MNDIEQIPIQIKIEFPTFVSAGNLSRIAALTGNQKKSKGSESIEN